MYKQLRGLRSFQWDSVADGVPTFRHVGSQKELVVRNQPADGQRDRPEMVLGVINTGGENRPVFAQNTPATLYRIRLPALDVHLDLGRLASCQQIVETNAFHFDGSLRADGRQDSTASREPDMARLAGCSQWPHFDFALKAGW